MIPTPKTPLRAGGTSVIHGHDHGHQHLLKHDAFDVFLVLVMGVIIFVLDLYAAALLNR